LVSIGLNSAVNMPSSSGVPPASVPPGSMPPGLMPSGPIPIVNNGQVAVSAVLLAIGPVFVILRFWARKIKKQPLQWDDYTILLALVGIASFLSFPAKRVLKHSLNQLVNTASCIHAVWVSSKHYIGYVTIFMTPPIIKEFKKVRVY
jgi:hypothetical protein